MTRKKSTLAILAVMVVTHGCLIYAPLIGSALMGAGMISERVNHRDRGVFSLAYPDAFEAALGALRKIPSVQIQEADRAHGLIEGSLSGLSIRVWVIPVVPGLTRLEVKCRRWWGLTNDEAMQEKVYWEISERMAAVSSGRSWRTNWKSRQ